LKKPSIPKGTRDFSPVEVTRRHYIMDTIRGVFNNFGFQPIETPSFENSDTLMGKYGEEGDRLIFKILNSGNFLTNFNDSLHSILKDSVYNLLGFLRVESNDWTIYKKRFLKEIPNTIRTTKSIQLSEEKIDLNQLAMDLWEIIEAKILNSQSDIELFTKEGEKRFGLYVLLVLGEFYNKRGENYLSKYISEKALRYDLTVPFARYVVQHQNDITFPFKRYQIQPVWRADRPQKGRFREFFQCDADVVGSTSLWQEVELVQLYDTVFSKLKLDGVTIKMNNRKILSGIAEMIGAEDKLIDFTVALDKLDKIGEEKVKTEMLDKGISQTAIEKLQPLFSVAGTASEKLATLKDLLAVSAIGMEGISELEFIVNAMETLELSSAKLEIDVTLARGLNYYTGAIFEVAAPEGVNMGSIGGGGRYDDLTGIFGMKDMSGVGISFGLDRIYLVLEELNLFPETVTASTKVLFINFGEKEALYAMQAISKLRKAGVNAELYPDNAKMGKQMGYADKRDIPFVVLAGESEINEERYTLKNMKSGEQETVSADGLLLKLK
tara:strand:+ start:140984 stop:142639 length:1656 start_codon:yes stop_codon:yes gene_type:complete